MKEITDKHDADVKLAKHTKTNKGLSPRREDSNEVYPLDISFKNIGEPKA